MAKTVQKIDAASFWQEFARSQGLTPAQADLFEQYQKLLSSWSERINLTTITGLIDIAEYHFKDSLAFKLLVDPAKVQRVVDVGTGAGFPGIPLAIAYPHLKVTLIEVTAKKIQFLDTIISQLGLGERVEIYDQDWRSFLRAPAQDEQTVFCARASLQPEDLIRIFNTGSPYKKESLVYWAALAWEPSDKVEPFVAQEVRYQVGDRERKLVLLKST